jgi:hypothetical protein
MFILNSYPDHGFVSQDTNVMFKFGLNKEKCLEKINNADNEYAMSILNLEERLVNTPYSSGDILSRHSDSSRIHLDDILNRLSLSIIFLT